MPPDKEGKSLINWKLGIGAVFGVASAMVAERLQGDPDNELGSYYASLQQAIRQRELLMTDSPHILIELPENRTVTKAFAAAAKKLGHALHEPKEPLPDDREIMPGLVHDIRNWAMRGDELRGLHFEEIDIHAEGRLRTISAFVGESNCLILWRSPEHQRALRILDQYPIAKKALAARGLHYASPPDTSP